MPLGAVREQEARQRTVNKQTNVLWVIAVVIAIPVALTWFNVANIPSNLWDSSVMILGFFVGTQFALILTIVGSLASIRAWRMTALIADQQDKQLAGVHSDVNSNLNIAVGKLETNLKQLESNLQVQTNEIQRGRQTIRIERRVRSFFRIRALSNRELNTIHMFRLEEEVAGHRVSFTPVTEDYCISVLERYLNYSQQSVDIQFQVKKRAYPATSRGVATPPKPSRVANVEAVIYFDIEKCYHAENLATTPLPLKVENRNGQLTLSCEGFRNSMQNSRPEHMSDETPSYIAVIARFQHNNRHVFIVSGLSQPGTQAAGTFLEHLFTLNADEAMNELNINPQVYKILSGTSHIDDPDGQPAIDDFCCVIKAYVIEPDFDAEGLQVHALYHRAADASWMRAL